MSFKAIQYKTIHNPSCDNIHVQKIKHSKGKLMQLRKKSGAGVVVGWKQQEQVSDLERGKTIELRTQKLATVTC